MSSKHVVVEVEVVLGVVVACAELPVPEKCASRLSLTRRRCGWKRGREGAVVVVIVVVVVVVVVEVRVVVGSRSSSSST